MRRTLSLLLPALIPSWRFFKTVAPSPRLQIRMGGDSAWQPLRPPPARVAPTAMLRRLFWNPRWNEHLYLVTLSERLADAPGPRTVEEISRRVLRLAAPPPGKAMQFRLVFVCREGAQLVEEELFVSDPIVPGSPHGT